MAKIWKMDNGVVTCVCVCTHDGKKVAVPLLKKVSLVETKELLTSLDVVEKYLDFNPALPNAAEMANNYDWFKSIFFIDFLRDAGKHITLPAP